MLKVFMLFIAFSVTLLSKGEVAPLKECQAYNNMKHSKNTHHVVLEKEKKYRIVKHHKGQNLIVVKGESPAQRWVDESCFQRSNRDDVSPAKSRSINLEDELTRAAINMSSSRVKKGRSSKSKRSQMLLALSWHNAFCESHRKKKECRGGLFSMGGNRYNETHFVLHGLWPQPINNVYCNIDRKYIAMDKHKQWGRLPNIGLSGGTEKALKDAMPGFMSNLYKHEWYKHGTCYKQSADVYYQDAIKLLSQVNESKVGTLFTRNVGKKVTLQQVRHAFDLSFGHGAGKHVEMKCKKGLITELWINLGGAGSNLPELLKSGKNVRSRCSKGKIDKVGFSGR